MTDPVAQLRAYGTALLKELTGRQAYFLEVPAAASAAALSVVSFEAVERMGEPYTVTIQLTHPLPLERADYLGKDATFLIDPADGTEPRKFAGCITRFSQTKQTHDFSSYEIVVEPLVARLQLTRASRVYQNKTGPQIIEAILRRHDLKGHQFVFKTRREYPQHKFRLQYQMSDWAYIRLLMEQEGLYSYFIPGKFGEMVVFGDDIDHYIYLPELRVLYRETAGLESGAEAVTDIKTHAQTVPESVRVADYNPDQSWERIQAEANIARKDKTTYGQSYVFGSHHLDKDGAKWEAQLRHEAAIAWQVVYEGESNVLDARPARILRMDRVLPDAPNGQVIIEVRHSGARDQAYRNTYKAIPSDRRFRLPLAEDKWPKIHGTLSARVTSPGQYKYAYLTQVGHYTVRFDLDFDAWPKGSESVPLRLAKAFAGALQTGFHFPVLDGTEAAIAFRDGNPNKPYIAHLHHNSQHVDLITSQDRLLSRNVIHTQSGNTLELEDWEDEEHVQLSTEHSGKSQLTLGHMVNGERKKRGEGFELRTSSWGAIRGGKGLFISADDQPKASGEQLAMSDAEDTLRQAMDMMRSLNDSANAAKAWLAEIDQQRALIEQTLTQLKAPAILASAPKGIGIASGRDMQIAAGKQIFMTAGGGLDIGVMKRITAAAGEAISLFAAKLGIRIFAAKGKVQIQAQGDALELMAFKNVVVSSSTGEVMITATKGITLGDGAGAYIRIANGKIELASPIGDVNVRGNLRTDDPAGGSFVFPAWETAPLQDVKHNMKFGFSE
ncbi:Rhs element Vgr protein [Cupriavidus basilensis OR16]|uniref:Rhs element Vgr protein n=1 Tax=Cupriavidus basilensis OR16 TaxID=1127483 RepID=H1SB91_9BURK|nr:type VI secretion system Vgr family protein [Cupriavidus basilensis]EHP40162.1 Rhs element Vgr protein [Cupriavidus basilensis OR16]